MRATRKKCGLPAEMRVPEVMRVKTRNPHPCYPQLPETHHYTQLRLQNSQIGILWVKNKCKARAGKRGCNFYLQSQYLRWGGGNARG